MVLDLFRKALARESPLAAEDDETTQRILDAALSLAQDFGLRRSTMEDVARRGGLSRITIYRRFPRKDRLVEAVVLRELHRFMTELDAAVAAQTTPTDRIVEACAFSVQWLRGHQLLNRLLQTEPESIVPHLTTQGGPVIEAARAHSVSVIRQTIFGDAPPSPEAERDLEVMAELGVRLTLSFVLTRDSVVPMDTPEDARRYARRYLVPMYAGMAAKHGITLGGGARRPSGSAGQRDPAQQPEGSGGEPR